MKNAPMPATESKSPEVQSDVQSKAEAIARQVQAEFAAILVARQAYHTALSKTGAKGLEMAAVTLGQSVNKKGYPSFEAYSLFTALMVLQKTDHTSFDRLARMARNCIGTNPDQKLADGWSNDDIAEAQKAFLTGTSKRGGAGNDSKATVKIKAPASLAVALGGQ